MTRTTKDNVIVKDIPSYPGKYAASTDGRIYSIRRQQWLKPYVAGSDYLYVDLCGKNKRVHRLIAETYLDNPMGYATVDHINGDKMDNRVENLQWLTLSENVRKAHQKGVIVETSDGKRVGQYESLTTCANALNVSVPAVWQACNGKGALCKNYVIKYAKLG